MSGANRHIPFEKVLNQTQAFLIVDLTTHKTRSTSALLPVPNKEPLKFEFDEQSITVVDVLYLANELKSGPVQKGMPVPYVSIAVQRSCDYQIQLAATGARRRMWYDQNPAFDEAPTGAQGLLLLKRYDEQFKAYEASMGAGILPIRYLEQVRAHLTARQKTDAPPPK